MPPKRMSDAKKAAANSTAATDGQAQKRRLDGKVAIVTGWLTSRLGMRIQLADFTFVAITSRMLMSSGCVGSGGAKGIGYACSACLGAEGAQVSYQFWSHNGGLHTCMSAPRLR